MTMDQLLSKAFNGKAENIVISKNIIMFHLDGVETRINLVSFIDQIYNDHEETTSELMAEVIHQTNKVERLKEQLKAKDEEIERLKADCELNGLRMFRQGVNSQRKADIGWLKSRSIVAMLGLWWRKNKYDLKNFEGDLYREGFVHGIEYCFLRGKEMLKEQQ